MNWRSDRPRSRYGFNSRLTLFKALIHSISGGYKNEPTNDYWKTPTVNWDNIARANVTSILQVSLAWRLSLSKPISKAGRFRETLALGLSYKFANYSGK